MKHKVQKTGHWDGTHDRKMESFYVGKKPREEEHKKLNIQEAICWCL